MAGCGCKGSTPATQKQVLTREQSQQQQAAARPRRTGLPGEPGYAWNGPKRSR